MNCLIGQLEHCNNTSAWKERLPIHTVSDISSSCWGKKGSRLILKHNPDKSVQMRDVPLFIFILFFYSECKKTDHNDN